MTRGQPATLGVSPSSIKAMMAAWGALGLDLDAIVSGAAFDRNLLREPDRFIPVQQSWKLMEQAQLRWAKPGLGLHAGAAMPVGSLDVLDYLLSSAPTFGAAMQAVVRYYSLVNVSASYRIDDDGCDSPRMTITGGTVPIDAHPPHMIDYSFGVLTSRARAMVGAQPLTVWLRRAVPDGDVASYERLLGGAVTFGAETNTLVFDRRDWQRANRKADPGLNAVLARHAEMLLRSVPRAESFIDRVRETVQATLLSGDARIDVVAKSCGLGRRTLQRRLNDHGVGFSELVDDVRKRLAEAYLRQDTLTVAEVGYVLGYSEPSGFTRAFKKWFATTPSAFRSRR